MTTKIESRGPIIDMEVCVNKIGGRYDLVLIGAQRLREIKKKDRESKRYSSTVDALMDVQNGIVSYNDYVVKIR